MTTDLASDITTRTKVERALADEREMLRTVIDAIPDPLFVKDRAGRHILQNLAHRRTFNLADDDPLGATVFELHPREFAELSAADDEKVMSSGEAIINQEEPYATSSGARGWFLTSKFPLRDSAGRVTGLVGICRDITALKRASEELARTRQRLVDHVENSPLAVLEWGADFRIRRWTGQAENMFGWRAGEVIGKHFKEWTFVHADDVEGVAEAVARLTDGGEQRNISHTRNFHSSGALVYCVWHNSVVRDTGGQTVSILSLVQDVTERVVAEETIRENERLYHTLVSATNTGYALIDERGFVLDTNEEFVRLTGRDSRQEIVGHCLSDWIALHDRERTIREIAACVEVGSIRNIELDYVTPDGRIVAVEMNARMQETVAGPRLVVFCRDISLRRRAEAESRAVDRRLQEKQKLESLGVLAGGIAHDFNNLLTGILGNASLAAANAGPDSTLRHCLDQIETGAMRAGDLCHQMLAYAGKGRFLIRPLDLNAIIGETINLLRISIKKNATLTACLAPVIPPVLADATQMRQIVMNLVINASESIADPSGNIVVGTSVVQADETFLARTHLAPELPEGTYVAIEVSDDGAGMSPEVQARIFDPFFTTKFTGRGLGLAAVLGIVRGHRGALQVESTPGSGTTFRVLLPVAEGAAETASTKPTTADRWQSTGTILVIDDEEAVRTTTAALLELIGFTVLVEPDGRAGAATFALRPEEIRLVLLDVTMPHFNGEETLHEIHRIKPDARVLLMSGFAEPEIARRFHGQQLAGFLPKPFMLSTLREKLQQILVQ